MKVGDRVRLTQDVDRFPHFRVGAGMTGTITVSKPQVYIRLDEKVDGAAEWDNQLILEEDEAGYVELIHTPD